MSKYSIVPIHKIHLSRLTVAFTCCINIFYHSLTDYLYYSNSLCQLDVGKTELVTHVNNI